MKISSRKMQVRKVAQPTTQRSSRRPAARSAVQVDNESTEQSVVSGALSGIDRENDSVYRLGPDRVGRLCAGARYAKRGSTCGGRYGPCAAQYRGHHHPRSGADDRRTGASRAAVADT